MIKAEDKKQIDRVVDTIKKLKPKDRVLVMSTATVLLARQQMDEVEDEHKRD